MMKLTNIPKTAINAAYKLGTVINSGCITLSKAPVMISSSIQATLIGRYGESDYGKIGETSKNATAKATDMSTDMKHIMHRANAQNKK